VHEAPGSPRRPLDTRSFLEQRSGHAFGRVRVLQQASGVVQRACDPALVGARTEPVFFPKQPKLMEVFDGTETLRRGAADREAVGLVQQALVDLCHGGGLSGPNRDGVDRKFGDATVKAVKAFQAAEGLTESGEVDLTTFRCLDETRSRRALPCKTGVALAPTDVVLDRALTGGRAEDIFFGRGDKTLDAEDLGKIASLAVAHKHQALTLTGFQSEDEVVDSGPGLARERIDAVDAELARQGHAKLRTAHAQPQGSGGTPDYPSRRKVEVAVAGTAPATPSCTAVPAGWTLPDQGPCDAATEDVVQDAIDRGVQLMTDALTALVPGDPKADGAVADRFGDKRHLPAVRAKLVTWKDHLDRFVRAHHTCTNACHGSCASAAAYTHRATKETFLCEQTMTPPPDATTAERQALTMIHEAGHGSLGTQDIAYDRTRLLAVVHKNFAVAEINTDSFVLLVQCLNGVTIDGLGCTVPPTGDTFPGLGDPKAAAAEEALAWQERWIDFVWQNVKSTYRFADQARETGAWTADDDFVKLVLRLVAKHFGLRRPAGDPAPTLREQTMLATLIDRFAIMRERTSKGIARELTMSVTATPEWIDSGPVHKVVVPLPFFTSMSKRQRVRALVKLLVQAQSGISSAAVPGYVNFTDDNAKLWIDQPR
jgi:peptidoglycan hydrolase-like protein with peptidoglycan-binding domain